MRTRYKGVLLGPIPGVVGLALLIIVIAAAASGCGGKQRRGFGNYREEQCAAATAATAPSAFNESDEWHEKSDVHKRAQNVVNLAEYCLVQLQLALQHTGDVNAMASSLDKAHSDCDGARGAIATANDHGFSDQSTMFFSAADEGKAASGAGLDYLDTNYPSKLADFRRHVRQATGDFNQGLRELAEHQAFLLGVPHVQS